MRFQTPSAIFSRSFRHAGGHSGGCSTQTTDLHVRIVLDGGCQLLQPLVYEHANGRDGFFGPTSVEKLEELGTPALTIAEGRCTPRSGQRDIKHESPKAVLLAET